VSSARAGILPLKTRSPDALLLARARRGDREALGKIIALHRGPAYALVARLLVGRPDLVDDVVQDALLKVVRNIGRFDPDGPARLSTWVLTIAARTGLDALRRTRRLEPLPDELPGCVLESTLLRRTVEEVMKQLSDDHRAVLVLRVFHDLDYPEIATALGIEEGTVKSRLSRARAALRQALGEAGDDHG
jgi:RNA polymerase sigma factor (sigma-70 family)